MGFSRQEYWSGLPFPSPGDLPDPEIEPGSLALQADALLSEPPNPRTWLHVTAWSPLTVTCQEAAPAPSSPGVHPQPPLHSLVLPTNRQQAPPHEAGPGNQPDQGANQAHQTTLIVSPKKDVRALFGGLRAYDSGKERECAVGKHRTSPKATFPRSETSLT